MKVITTERRAYLLALLRSKKPVLLQHSEIDEIAQLVEEHAGMEDLLRSLGTEVRHPTYCLHCGCANEQACTEVGCGLWGTTRGPKARCSSCGSTSAMSCNALGCFGLEGQGPETAPAPLPNAPLPGCPCPSCRYLKP